MTILLQLRLAATLLVALLLAGPARAQTLTADWAVPCAANGGPTNVAADTQGNTYVTGIFSGTVTLGTTTLVATQTAAGNTGPRDTFLAKLNALGQYQWAVQFGDGQSAQPSGVAVDNAGNIYLTGSFNSYSLQVGSNGPMLYNSSNDYEGFIASFSGQSGQCQWARRFGGTGTDGGGLVTVNTAGELYLTGSTGGGVADFGPFTLAAATPSYVFRGFLAKLNAAGNWLWAQQLGSNGQVNISGLVLDGQGGIYLSGGFASPGVTLGTAVLATAIRCGGATGYDIVVAKYTEMGNFVWAVQGDPTGQNNASGGSIVYDGQGYLYTASSFNSQQLRLGSFVLANASQQLPPPIGPAPPYTCTDRYYTDAYVARLDASTGAWQWAMRQGGQYSDGAGMIALDATGQLLINYYENGNRQLTQVNTITGTWSTSYLLPVTTSFVNKLSGRLYLSGTFTTTTLNVGGQTVANAGTNGTTGFVARLGGLVLATQPAMPASLRLQAWPTPGPGTGVWVQGAPAGQAVDVLDMLGRRVGGRQMPASGPLHLSWPGAGLAPGLYVVRSGVQSCRWVVE